MISQLLLNIKKQSWHIPPPQKYTPKVVEIVGKGAYIMIYVCWGPVFLEPNLVRFDFSPILQVFYVNWLRHILITSLFFTLFSLLHA